MQGFRNPFVDFLFDVIITKPILETGQMIRGFRCEETEKIFRGEFSKRFPHSMQPVASRKLVQLDIAKDLGDLRVPPGNCLEALRGKRKGQHSIRINRQWRICFVWEGDEPTDVEIVDYH